MGWVSWQHPLIVKNVDGTIYQDGTIMHYCNLWVCQGQQMEKLGFYVANLGRDWVILGYPWFKSYNPDFDWNSNILKGEEVFIDMAGYQSKHCLVITTIQVTQEEITKDKEEVLKTIPPQYHKHWKVFSEHTSYWFPPAWEKDHTIILKEGAPDTIDCRVYCQMEMELEATWQFITEALAKRVHHRLQIAICIGTFLLEKEGWKTLTHHGLLHIKSMDSTQYIPSPPHWQHPWPLTRENLVHQNGHLVRIQQYTHQGRRPLENCFQNCFWSLWTHGHVFWTHPLPCHLLLHYEENAMTNTQQIPRQSTQIHWWPPGGHRRRWRITPTNCEQNTWPVCMRVILPMPC